MRSRPTRQGQGIGGGEGRAQVGPVLRGRREQLGLTLEQVHAQLRIPVRWLRAIEEDRFDVFDASQYAKGFVRSYAEFLGLDPEPLVRAVAEVLPGDRKPQLVAPSGDVPIRPVAPPSRLRRVLVWTAVVLAAVVVWLGYLGYRQLRAFYASTQAAAPAASPPPATADHRPQGVPSPALPPPAMAGEPVVRLVLSAEDVSWLRVVADGRRVFEGFIRAGERREWEATGNLQVVIGNAGGVRVEVNGVDLGVLGAPGEVVRRTFTPPPRP